MDVLGKVALVTGASRGIGREISRRLAGHGARIAVHFEDNEPAARETLPSLPDGPHVPFRADVPDGVSARELVDAVVGEMGRVDVLVDNAGIFEHHPIPSTGYEERQEVWHRTLGTNLVGPANVSFCAARHMMERGGGRIVNVSSRGAFRGEPYAPAYGASKAGLNAMSQSMAKALAPHNVFVYAGAPGFVETEMAAFVLPGPEGDTVRRQSPLGRVARPEEVARAVLFLASEGTDFMTGCILDVNGASSYLRS